MTDETKPFDWDAIALWHDMLPDLIQKALEFPPSADVVAFHATFLAFQETIRLAYQERRTAERLRKERDLIAVYSDTLDRIWALARPGAVGWAYAGQVLTAVEVLIRKDGKE